MDRSGWPLLDQALDQQVFERVIDVDARDDCPELSWGKALSNDTGCL
jgi:hypothetical protein